MIYMSTRLNCFSIVSMTDIGSISESGIVLIAFFNHGYVSCDEQCHPLIYAVQDSSTPNQHKIHICVSCELAQVVDPTQRKLWSL